MRLYKKRKIAKLVSLLMFFLIIFTIGCAIEQEPPQQQPQDSQNQTSPSEELQNLLPEEVGFKWIYSGFAEYGHDMELESIDRDDTTIRYDISGNVHDPSGGEAQGDFSLNIKYEITDESLIMHKNAERMMDNFSEMELVRLPLEEGTQWEQTVKHKNGDDYTLTCTIKKIEDTDKGKIYTILYKDKNSDFYEKRRIQENWGIISFETIWESGEGPMTIGYDLYFEASGYPDRSALNASFTPSKITVLLWSGGICP